MPRFSRLAFLLPFPFLLLAALWSSRHRCLPAWDPDAGLVRSFTENATVTTSSNPAQASKLLDDDPSSAWQSEAPLPVGYISRSDLNIFLGKAGRLCQGSPARYPELMTDGDLSTAATIAPASGKATLVFSFEKNTPLHLLSVKCQATVPISIGLETPDGKTSTVATYTPTENFTLKKIDLNGHAVRRITLQSDGEFGVFEIAALDAPPTEWAIVDLGKIRPVVVIHSRHWAGEQAALATKLYLSTDKNTWTQVATLDPTALPTVVTNVYPETNVRFIKIEHTLPSLDWAKVFLWEMKVYDRHGHYGERPRAHQSNVSLREMLGVNGYWSWGTNKYSDQLTETEGPLLYRPVASHARNYHDMTWDIDHPGQPIGFSKMASGQGTPAKDWLNWDREYKAWRAAGLNVQASLQFYRFHPSQWNNPYQDAYNYAAAFTRHFGLKSGNGYICTIEAGNEPWKYPAEVYRKILLGMAQGARAADPTMEVFPCALQAADPSTEKSDGFKNYIGARITPETATLLDGINLHAYSWVTTPKGVRIAVHPEHPNSTFWEILNAIRWRNRNMPGKKIYLSEWGWDAPGGGDTCTHSECVSERAAAAYAVRAALIAARLGIDRATWFFYANENTPSSLFSRSGLTGSVSTGFKKKKVFLALQSLTWLAGDKYFLEVVREDETAYLYLLGNAAGKPTHLVAWKPIDADDPSHHVLPWKTSWRVKEAFRLDGYSPSGTPADIPVVREGTMFLEIGAIPLLVVLQ